MGSSHPEARALLGQGLFSNLSTFSDFEQRLHGLTNTKQVGDAFEILVEAYLHTQPKMQASSVWLVGQVPLRIRSRLNLPSDSKGIDGVFETRAGRLVPYQVKYRTERDVLPYGEVSSFLGITERSCKDRVIFTNARGLSKDVENRDGLRSVRASHFQSLTGDDFAAIEAWLVEKPVRHERRQPRPYQQEAIQKLSEALRERPRATAVMACGTGKTLVALWVAEALEPRTVLVLVPSLALLSQTLPEWCRESKWGGAFEYLCVCSDPTVSKGVDAYTIRPQDTDFAITTDAREVRRFLDRTTYGVKVVFSTYQSAPVVSEGMKGLDPFDLGVFDEAHKTTGPKAGLFSFGLDDSNLPIARRLFLTATPRHYDMRRRDREGDFRLISMDDESVYGPVAYRLPFSSAVRQGIICPYKIVISVTTKAEVDADLLKRGVVLVKRDQILAQWVATQLALKRAIAKTKARKVITFHSRVALAAEFASDRSTGIQQYLKGFEVFHVNGGQPTADRESLLSDFKSSDNGLITNARCLTEGVDVPAVDMVAFIDPRRSKVDIAQATGRAMRQSRATGKTTGYVVVPMFLEQRKGESEAAALKRSGFNDIAMVIAAMQDQDEDLVDVIRELRQKKGEGRPFKPRRLADKLEVIGPSIKLRDLTTAIRVQVVERLGLNWDEMFGQLLCYRKAFGDCRVPTAYVTKDGKALGNWVAWQRNPNHKLLPVRRKKLESVKGWVWNEPEEKWNDGYNHLVEYCRLHGSSRVPRSYRPKDGFPLAQWVAMQRSERSAMAPERARKLESVKGWSWAVWSDKWEASFNELVQFTRRHGHCLVPGDYKTEDGINLGAWVMTQRTQKDSMPDYRVQRLQRLPGWSWQARATRWEEGYKHLKSYSVTTGNCLVPVAYTTTDGFRLGQWVSVQRTSKERMPKQRRKQLESLSGWSWDPLEDAWQRGLQYLKAYRKAKRDCLVPALHKTDDGYRLGAWVNRQRFLYSKGRMTSERIDLLEAVDGWAWRAHLPRDSQI